MSHSLVEWNVLTKELQRRGAKRVIDRLSVSERLCKQSAVLFSAADAVSAHIHMHSKSFSDRSAIKAALIPALLNLLKVDQNAVA